MVLFFVLNTLVVGWIAFRTGLDIGYKKNLSFEMRLQIQREASHLVTKEMTAEIRKNIDEWGARLMEGEIEPGDLGPNPEPIK